MEGIIMIAMITISHLGSSGVVLEFMECVGRQGRGNLTVLGDVRFQKNVSVGELRSKGTMLCESNSLVQGDLQVSGKLMGSSANFSHSNSSMHTAGYINATDGYFEKNITIGERLIMNSFQVTPRSIIFKNSPLIIPTSNVTIGKGVLFVKNTIYGQNVTVGDLLRTDSFWAKSKISSEGDIWAKNRVVSGDGGFLSHNGSVTCARVVATNVSVAGNIRVDHNIIARNIHATSSLIVPDVTVNDTLHTKDLNISGSLHIISDEGAIINSSLRVHGNIRNEGVLTGKEAVLDSIKTKSSFSSRVYTKDIVASGFLSAGSIASKGDIELNGGSGKLRAGSLYASNYVESQNIHVNQSISCTTAQVNGTVNAAGVTARKVSIKSDLQLRDKNVWDKLNELDELIKRVRDLEDAMKQFLQK